MLRHRDRLALTLLVELTGACSGRSAPRDDATPTATKPTLPAPPAPSQTGEGSVKRIEARSDVSLTGPRVDARPGDWLLENDGQVAVVDARGGRIVDFGTAGHDDALVAIEPTVYVGLDDVRTEIADVGPAPDAPRVIRIERRVRDAPLSGSTSGYVSGYTSMWTFVSFAGPALRIESLATSTSDAGTSAVTLGERVGWGNVPTWVEGTGFIAKGGTYSGDFIAREGFGEAYALGLDKGRLVARFNAPEPGFHERAHTGEETLELPSGEPSPRRSLWLAHADGALGDAVVALERARGTTLVPLTLPGVAAERAVAEIASCPATTATPPDLGHGAPFERFAMANTPHDVLVPKGCFRVRATAPGYASGAWAASDHASAMAGPRAGRLHWHVTEGGASTIPARLIVRGVPPTSDPDWGDEPHEGAALEAIVSLGEGEVPIPAGRYRVILSRGFEYTTSDQTIAVDDGRTTSIEASLERVVDTRGWISADLHVHAVPSPDAPTLLDDRVRSLAASGVEVAAATDHNAITDYGPTIRALGAQHWLASMVGDEVTTRGVELGHFNVFPLEPGETPLPYQSTTPHDIFTAARAAAPVDRDKVVQVNHPRMGAIGYFELIHLDPNDFEGWRRRAPLFDPGFDALEVFNGDDYAALEHVEACMRDWYALLDAGLRVTATGNSDSHKLTYHEAGVPRNFVRVAGDASDAPDAFDERAFVDAVRHGRVVVSSGPFVRIRAGGAEVGGEIASSPATASGIDVRVQVDAPPWVDVSSVELVRRGETVTTWHPKLTQGPVHFDATAHVALGPGDWVIAIARGTKPMAFLHRPGALPFGFTNPIYVR
ncbi:MAG TPA: CehA/McbA family metallohydrolase [Polyangiaceae bacterium]